MNRAPRAGERGVSVLEALIVTAISAILIVLILPLAPEGMRRDYGLAQRTLTAAAGLRGEASFQAILRDLVQPAAAFEAGVADAALNGDGQGFAATFAASQTGSCAEAGERGVVSLRIDRIGRGGRLMCRGEMHEAELARWTDGAAQFTYSGDGVAWRRQWPPARAPNADPSAPRASASVLVRFRLEAPQVAPVEWVARAGFTEPLEVRVEAPADRADDP